MTSELFSSLDDLVTGTVSAPGSRAAMGDQFTASGYPKDAGRREPSPGRSSAQGAGEDEQSSAVIMETSWDSGQGSVDQARERTHLPYQHSQGLASHGLCCCQFLWGESCPRGAAFHPEAARDFIHTPFAFPLRLES